MQSPTSPTKTTSSSIPTTTLDERLSAEKQVKTAYSTLTQRTAEHTHVLLSVHRRSQALHKELNKLLQELNSSQIEDEVRSSLEQRAEDMSNVAERHKMRRRTLLQHSTLLEILEIPSLMDACVRCHLYNEALSLASFCNEVERSHNQSDSSKIIENVVREVRRREVDLRRHLILRLRSELSLPQCLEIVTALRRLNGIEIEREQNRQVSRDAVEKNHAVTELRLQVDFFEARDAWLEAGCNNAASPTGLGESITTSATELLLDLIETYRTRCFEIATQFLAIFRTSQSKSNAPSDDVSLLSLWMSRRVQLFIGKLKEGFSAFDESTPLRDVLDATVFFATSMGRVGADFQALLPPLFEAKLVDIVSARWNNGCTEFSDSLSACRNAGVATSLFSDSSSFVDIGDSTESNTQTTLGAPRNLLSYPPLGRLSNAFLLGLNELRRCLLPGVFPVLKSLLEGFLQNVDATLQMNQKAVMAPGFKGDASALREMAAKYRDEFEKTLKPFFKIALDFALGYEVVIDPKADDNYVAEGEETSAEEEANAGIDVKPTEQAGEEEKADKYVNEDAESRTAEEETNDAIDDKSLEQEGEKRKLDDYGKETAEAGDVKEEVNAIDDYHQSK